MNDIIKRIESVISVLKEAEKYYLHNRYHKYDNHKMETPNCDMLEKIIQDELKDNTFIKIPKKVKLSSIVERLKTEGFDYGIEECDNHEYCCLATTLTCYDSGIDLEVLGVEINANEGKIFNINLYQIDYHRHFKWLYEYWIANTEIEVDM